MEMASLTIHFPGLKELNNKHYPFEADYWLVIPIFPN